jgi:hypothetical protein
MWTLVGSVLTIVLGIGCGQVSAPYLGLWAIPVSVLVAILVAVPFFVGHEGPATVTVRDRLQVRGPRVQVDLPLEQCSFVMEDALTIVVKDMSGRSVAALGAREDAIERLDVLLRMAGARVQYRYNDPTW